MLTARIANVSLEELFTGGQITHSLTKKSARACAFGATNSLQAPNLTDGE
jgi:hypothetical protein